MKIRKILTSEYEGKLMISRCIMPLAYRGTLTVKYVALSSLKETSLSKLDADG